MQIAYNIKFQNANIVLAIELWDSANQIALLGLAAILNFGLAPNSQISDEIY